MACLRRQSAKYVYDIVSCLRLKIFFLISPKLIVISTHIIMSFIYKAESLFVSLYLIEIHISEPIWTTLCTHLLLGLEESVGYVWSEKCLTFSTFLTFFAGNECQMLGTKWPPAQVIRDSVISVILAGVIVTSRKWRCSRRQFRVLTGSVVHYGQCINSREM
jgi:hypothetical protein